MKATRKSIVSGFAWRFSEQVFGQLVSFVVSVILARILLPAEYGTVAIVIIFTTLAGVFISSGLSVSLIQKKNADDLDFSTVFYFNLAFALILYFILFFAAPWIAKLYGLAELTPAIRVMGVCLFVYAVNSVQQAYVSRQLLFQRLFWSSLAGTLLSAAVGIWMAVHGYGIWALIAQKLIDAVFDTLILWFMIAWRPKLLFSIERMKTLFCYGWKLICAALLNTASAKLRAFFIGTLFSVEDLAFYEKGNQYPQLAVTDISSSIGAVLFPVLSKVQEDPAEIKRLTRRAVRVSSFLMWPSMAVLCVIAEPLVGWMLTDKWLPCVPYFQIACFSLAFMPIHISNLQALKAVGRSDLFLILEAVKTVFSIAVLLVSLPFGVKGIAIGVAISSLLATFINAYPNRKQIGYSYKEQMQDMLPPFFFAAVTGAAVWPLSLIIHSRVPLLLLQTLLGFSLYFFWAKLLKQESYRYCTSIVREFLSGRKKKEAA